MQRRKSFGRSRFAFGMMCGGMAGTDRRQMSASRRRCAFRLCLSILECDWANLICTSFGRSVSNEHDSRATRRNKTENKTEQFHSLFGQRGGSSRKGLNPLDEIVICVFESGERMIRSMFAAAHASVQRARLTQRRLIIAGLWLGAEF